MDNPNNGYNQDAPRPAGGRLSAAAGGSRPRVQRPSMDELAPYSAINYTSRGTKGNQKRGKAKRNIIIAIAAVVVLLVAIPGVALGMSAKSAMDDAKMLMSQGSALASQIQSGDVQGAQRTAGNLSSVQSISTKTSTVRSGHPSPSFPSTEAT